MRQKFIKVFHPISEEKLNFSLFSVREGLNLLGEFLLFLFCYPVQKMWKLLKSYLHYLEFFDPYIIDIIKYQSIANLHETYFENFYIFTNRNFKTNKILISI